MAEGGAALVAKFQEFIAATDARGNKSEMKSNSCNKLVDDCWKEKYGKYEVKQTIDASVFSVMKEKHKPYMVVNVTNCDKFMTKAAEEIFKKKTKKTKVTKEDESEVKVIRDDLLNLVITGKPHVKQVKTSATGGVDKMTDTSKYTGAHKERFDESGKGKGADGRVDKQSNTGYVGNYKNEGTYGTKK